MNVKNIFIFSIGMVSGSLATYAILKRKFDAEKEAIRNLYKSENTENTDEEKDKKEYNVPKEEEIWEDKDIRPTKEDIANFKNNPPPTVDYTQCVDIANNYNKPVVIDPSEFGVFPEFDEPVTLYWNPATGVLRNPISNHILSDTERLDLIGPEALNHFGEYEDDSVYVRNPRLKVDVEILLE